jgi:uncharacterized protein YwqG
MGLFKSNKTPVATGIYLSKLASLWPSLSAGELQAVHITARRTRNMRPAQSKFGGNLILPNGVPAPTNSKGQKLVPLAQLNHSEMPPMEGFPEKGWTQFYTGRPNTVLEDQFGMNWDNPIKQENFRVLHFEALDENNAHTILHDPKVSPIASQYALSFSLQTEYTGIYDIRFKQRFGKGPYELAEGFGKGFKAAERELTRYFAGNQHKAGGYAWFPEEPDPRYRNIAFKDYILLLQIVHQRPGIKWGKKGVGGFFIHPDDLKKKDFSKVIFHWDTVGNKQ